MIEHLEWEFPLPRTHTGVLLGNATMGVMVWGAGATLRMTLGRADLWDHRGGMPWTDKQNYRDIRRCLEAGDEPGLRALFVTQTEHQPGQPVRPSVVPVGRLELDLGRGACLQRGDLNVRTGELSIHYELDGVRRSLVLTLAMDCNVLAVQAAGSGCLPVTDLPAWDTMGDTLPGIGFPPPHRLPEAATPRGWIQDLPADPAIAVLHRQVDDTLWVATARGDDQRAALAAGQALLETARSRGLPALRADTAAWWHDYWQDVPSLRLPNPALEALYVYGMTKFAGFSQPAGVPGTLQGPWIEDYQMPPWSSDYHFNINVQMCYWPAFKGNRLSHLLPLFDMIFSWEETLQRNAKAFIGIDDGVMLPHAVDDRCTCMGGFWTGCIDHGCTAWVAQMMYDYATWSGDAAFLRDKAYPFMRKTMRVYEAMLERTGAGFRLPVSVSPEYRGAAMNAWGANASFQLACIHRLVRNLLAAAAALGEVPAPIWQEIADGLPVACLTGSKGGAEIALWEGTPLEESHRHHSHLAGICPFDVIDASSGEWRGIVARSLRRWVDKGMGRWSGWCVPWASMLHSRFGNGAMAELLLTIWESVFTNQGRGTLHDCNFPGFTLIGAGSSCDNGKRGEIMQLDAGFGAVVAIQDMLLHARGGVQHLFPGVPETWGFCAFEGMLSEGGFLISASREHGRTVRVGIHARLGGMLRIANPWPGRVAVFSSRGGSQSHDGAVLELEAQAGETIEITEG